MTAREYVREIAGWGGDLAYGLFCLGNYLNRGGFFEQFPDADVPEDFLEDPDEPAGFQDFIYCRVDRYVNDGVTIEIG